MSLVFLALCVLGVDFMIYFFFKLLYVTCDKLRFSRAVFRPSKVEPGFFRREAAMKLLRNVRPLFIFVVVIVAVAGVSNFPKLRHVGPAVSVVRADDGCSAGSLHGTYAVHGQGTFLAAVPGFPAPPFPFGEAGIATFNGAGELSGKTTINAGGLLLTPTFTGTYTVNRDCTGNITIQSDLGSLQEAIVVIGHGERYVGTETDAAAVVVRTVERLAG